MKVTSLGHAALAIQIKNIHILVDPFISANPLAKDIDIQTLKADYILLTHAHQDHILDVEAIAKRTNAKIVSNYEIVSHYQNLGFEGHPMNLGGSWQFDFGRLHMVNAIHTSSFPDGSYGGQPGGFVIESDEGNLYIAGDTALSMDMKLIPMFTKLDLAVLPVGDNFTMGPEAAVMAADFLECKRILGYHYDTFGYIVIDHDKAVKLFSGHKKELMLLPVGGAIEV
jgi:L-ascorbate metabolism protein UlaG (beta-lactamase superfamily)